MRGSVVQVAERELGNPFLFFCYFHVIDGSKVKTSMFFYAFMLLFVYVINMKCLSSKEFILFFFEGYFMECKVMV